MRKKPEDRIVEFIKTNDYGTLVPHLTIANMIGASYGTYEYYSIMSKAKKALEGSGKEIVNDRKSGYRILKPGEYTKTAVKLLGYGLRTMERGNKTLYRAPVSDMTSDEREAHNRVSDRTHQLLAAMTGGLVEVKRLERKHPLLER